MGYGMAGNFSHTVKVTWTGDRGEGTRTYERYGREPDHACPGKPIILGSADPSFRGEAERDNPGDLLAAAPPTGHMLW